jgi:hypothetical protein
VTKKVVVDGVFFLLFFFVFSQLFPEQTGRREEGAVWVGGVSVGTNYRTTAQKVRVSRFFFGAKNDEKIFRDGFDLPLSCVTAPKKNSHARSDKYYYY